MKRRRKVSPSQQRRIQFHIERMDGLGQGIDQGATGTSFIAKTLPGETGTARVHKASKGVSFAELETLTHSAPNRIEPDCEHFAECPGCQYLHTDYQSELHYKLAALSRLCRSLPIDTQQIDVVSAPARLGYRNRIQLHYRHRYLGLVDATGDRVVEIPQCQLIDDGLRSTFQALYDDKSWAEEHFGRGHCELYLKDGQVQTQWNQPYAQGGFTQVNNAMNTTLCAKLAAYANQGPAETVLELFAGQGNLSDGLIADRGAQRVMVDYTTAPEQRTLPGYHNLDLFDNATLAELRRREATKQFDLMIVDPPRKGFTALAEWVQAYRPKQLIYVSCNAATLVRDLKNLQGKFTITDVCLMDLFPATHHFETLVRVAFRNHNKR